MQSTLPPPSLQVGLPEPLGLSDATYMSGFPTGPPSLLDPAYSSPPVQSYHDASEASTWWPQSRRPAHKTLTASTKLYVPTGSSAFDLGSSSKAIYRTYDRTYEPSLPSLGTSLGTRRTHSRQGSTASSRSASTREDGTGLGSTSTASAISRPSASTSLSASLRSHRIAALPSGKEASQRRQAAAPQIVVTRASGQPEGVESQPANFSSESRLASEAGSSLASSLASKSALTAGSSVKFAASRYATSHGSSFQDSSELHYAPSSLRFGTAAPSTLGATSLANRNAVGQQFTVRKK